MLEVLSHLYDFMYFQPEPDDLNVLGNLFISLCKAVSAEPRARDKSDTKARLASLCNFFITLQKREGDNDFIALIVETAQDFLMLEEVASFISQLQWKI